MMSRGALEDCIQEQTEDILEMFSKKNKEYGANMSGFHNFEMTALKMGGHPVMSEVSYKDRVFLSGLTLMDKHVVALFSGLTETNECADKLMDIAVYALIMRSFVLVNREDLPEFDIKTVEND